ncbi:MAG: radical SAM protein [Deltaproteobacteria bacterium]|nr:radical SAM protein [Deltaproteobacteria bacterium]
MALRTRLAESLHTPRMGVFREGGPMTRILLLNPPAERPIMRDTIHPTAKSAMYIWHPLDLLIQSAHMRDMELRIHDGVVTPGFKALERTLKAFRPDGVFSLVAWPTIDSDMRILRWIKETTGAVIFAEGDITYGQKEVFLEEYSFLDGILADFTSQGFVRRMRGEAPINAAWWENGKVVSDWKRDPVDYGVPRHELLRLDQYYLPYWKPPFASVYGSHGCSSKCSFCPVPDLGAPMFRPLERVIEELEFLYDMGVRKVFFREATFNLSATNTIRLCETIARRFPGMRFTCWFRPNPLSREIVDAMADAGFEYAHIGVETGSAEFLRALNKDFELADVPRAVEMMKRRGIKTIGHFMIGVPGEREKDRRETIRYLRKTRLSVVSVGAYEESFGAKLRHDAATRQSDRILRWRLIQMMAAFYTRLDRWPGFFGFVEDAGHLAVSLFRFADYLLSMRLFPRVSAWS